MRRLSKRAHPRYSGALSNDHADGIGLRFALQVTGFELATEPPAPDTPLARLLTYSSEHEKPGDTIQGMLELPHENLTDEHFDMAKLGLL